MLLLYPSWEGPGGCNLPLDLPKGAESRAQNLAVLRAGGMPWFLQSPGPRCPQQHSPAPSWGPRGAGSAAHTAAPCARCSAPPPRPGRRSRSWGARTGCSAGPGAPAGLQGEMGGAGGTRGAVPGPHPGTGLLSTPRTPAGLRRVLSSGLGDRGGAFPKCFGQDFVRRGWRATRCKQPAAHGESLGKFIFFFRNQKICSWPRGGQGLPRFHWLCPPHTGTRG